MSYKVSTSEVATFLTCKQRWMYAHHPSYNLEPRTLGIALTRGIVGHEALEIYYNSIMNTQSHELSIEAVNDYFMKRSLHELTVGDSSKAEMISSLWGILRDYIETSKWILDKFNIVGAELLVTAPLPEVSDIDFAGRIDLALGIMSGPHKGEVIPWDHKFTYNFWPEMSIKMNAQISNYVWALRQMGYRSRKGTLNMLRYRENAIEGFKQEEVPTNSHLREAFIKNHVEAAKVIVDLKQKDRVGLKDGVTRSTSKFNCEYCPFSTLCYTEACGLESETMVKASFRPNSYGYDSELDVS